jgi:hypothetical protein
VQEVAINGFEFTPANLAEAVPLDCIAAGAG